MSDAQESFETGMMSLIKNMLNDGFSVEETHDALIEAGINIDLETLKEHINIKGP